VTTGGEESQKSGRGPGPGLKAGSPVLSGWKPDRAASKTEATGRAGSARFIPCTAWKQCPQGRAGAGVSERGFPESEAAPWQGIAERESRCASGRARGRQAGAQNELAKIASDKNGPANQ